MIIDGHVHITRNRGSSRLKESASVGVLLEKMKASSVDKAVLVPLAPFVENHYIGVLCREYPEKFIGFASIDFRKEGVRELFKDIKAYDLKGIKIHPRMQKVKLLSKKVVEVVREAAKLNLPVMIDCFPQVSKDFPVEETLPGKIFALSQKVPQAKIILAHAGGFKLWDAFFMAKANPNIYLEFSFSPSYFKGSTLEKDFGFVLDKLGANRCLYGSDYPEVPIEKSLAEARQLVKRIIFSQREIDFFFAKTLLSILPN